MTNCSHLSLISFTPLKTVSLIAVFLLGSSSLANSDTAFKDIPGRYWASPSIQFLNERGVITGYADQTFQPNRPVTRAEFAVILAKSQGLKMTPSTPQNPSKIQFSDVPTSHWANKAIQTIVEQGWMAGYPNRRFRPNQSLTMAEMYVILSRVQTGAQRLTDSQTAEILRFYRDSDELPGWARIPVAQAIQSGITITERSRTRLFPDLPAVRASVATSVAKLVNPAFRENKNQVAKTPVKTPESPELNSVPAVNIVGILETSPETKQWILTRADGRQFPLSSGPLDSSQWQVGQQVRITGNLDALAGTAANPTIIVQTFSKIEPAPKAAPPVTLPPEPPVVNEQPLPNPVDPPEQATQTRQQTPAPSNIYFPNLANLVSDPALMLGKPAPRRSEELSNPHKAVEAILQGPNAAERKEGFFTDEEVKRLRLDKLTLNEGLASVTLSAPGDFQFSNSSIPARLSEQIRRTLTQFETIQQVKISVKNPAHKDLWISP
jgi:hypothetical protein